MIESFRKKTRQKKNLQPLAVSEYLDKNERDERYLEFRKEYKHVTKFSTVVEVAGPADGELKLDNQNRVVYQNVWGVAYGGRR